MLYSIVCQDNAHSLEGRKSARPAHLARLETLKENGKLVLAGPNPALDTNEPGEAGFTGSIIIAQFDSLEDAKKWSSEDPYLEAGVYKDVEVKPFKQVF
ncbi:YciI family protein [Marinomonas balearica]|uniref:YCII-related domain-containing protein n=1 Tax=Marinomonas balearica TaxID=491947 RepID=A0A4R6M527_9GAMM|nr:YciI family protein [Marinomonas balearica]TDO96441.1 hypothetical protein DFP79_3016 [Marinomonas balearica]